MAGTSSGTMDEAQYSKLRCAKEYQKYFKKLKEDADISISGKQILMNVFSNIYQENIFDSLNVIVAKTSDVTGFCTNGILDIRNEFKENGGKVRVDSAKKKKRDEHLKSKNYNDETIKRIKQTIKSAINDCEAPSVASLCVAVNADETLPDFSSMSQFRELLKNLGFNHKQFKFEEEDEPVPPPKKSKTTELPPLSEMLTLTADPYNVTEVKLDQYKDFTIVYQEENLILYEKVLRTGTCYDLVVHRYYAPSEHTSQNVPEQNGYEYSLPSLTCSLFRSDDKTKAAGYFLRLKDLLPVFFQGFSHGINTEVIKKFFLVARQNPTWTIAHLAAHFGWTNCFKFSQVDCVCSETFMTPLHVAVLAERPATIYALKSYFRAPDAVDKKGETPLHYAAKINRELITALAAAPSQELNTINKQNSECLTPLHVACSVLKPDCVRELLKMGADVNATGPYNQLPLQYLMDAATTMVIKTEDLPQHWRKVSECVEILLEFGCEMDGKNYQGNTVLHLMASKGYLSGVLLLLKYGADGNLTDAAGNTAFHIAAQLGDLSLIQSLALFGADPNVMNNEGKTPRHLAGRSRYRNQELIIYILHIMGAMRCDPNRNDCTTLCSALGTYNGEEEIPFPVNVEAHKLMNNFVLPSRAPKEGDHSPCRVLCLDSGGMRGIILVQLLYALEEILGPPITKHFEWIAGTGTGGILALALALGKPLSTCRSLFFRMKDKIFADSISIDPHHLDNLLKEEFGDACMADINDVRVLVKSLLPEKDSTESKVYRNYTSPSHMTRNSLSLEPTFLQVWEIAKSLGISPSAVQPLSKFIDVALVENDPTLDMLTEIHEYNKAMRSTINLGKPVTLTTVVSLGTGLNKPEVEESTAKYMKPNSEVVLDNTELRKLILEKAHKAKERSSSHVRMWCSSHDIHYVRLSPPLSQNIAYDEKDNAILVNAIWETITYLYGKKDVLKQLLPKLLME